MKLLELDAQEFRCQTIVKLRNQGLKQVQIADLVGCSQAWVSQVLCRHRNQDPESNLIKGTAVGAVAKLKAEHLQRLKQILLEGGLSHGFDTDNWTRARIAQVILDRFGVSYHPAHISRLMRRIGFSLQKPIAHSYRQDRTQIQHWKRVELPALKKSRD